VFQTFSRIGTTGFWRYSWTLHYNICESNNNIYYRGIEDILNNSVTESAADNVRTAISGRAQDKSINPCLRSRRRRSSCGTMILLSVRPSITIRLYRTHPPCSVVP